VKALIAIAILAGLATASMPGFTVCKVSDFGTPVRAAGFCWPAANSTGDKLAMVGGQLAMVGTVATIATVIADHNEAAKLRWYHWTAIGMVVTGWSLWLAGNVVR